MIKLAGTGITDIEEENSKYRWIIKNFKSIFQHSLNDKKVISIDKIPRECQTLGIPHKLSLYCKADLIMPVGTANNPIPDSKTFCLKLESVDYGVHNQQDITFYAYIQDKHNQQLFRKKFEIYSPFVNFSEYNNWMKVGQFWENEENILDSSGALTIVLETFKMNISTNHVTDDIALKIKSDGISNMEKVLTSKEFCDLTFEVGTGENKQKILAHKAIVAAASPVFEALLKSPMSEKLSNIVSIPDIEPDVFEKVLYHIYTDSAPPSLNEFAVQLLQVAEKYQLSNLKKMCMNCMVDNVENENVVPLYLMSLTYDVTKVREQCVNHIVRNFTGVVGSSSWKKLHDEPETMDSLFRDVCRFQVPKSNDKQNNEVGLVPLAIKDSTTSSSGSDSDDF